MKVEAYHKDYRDFPLDPTQPELFLLDELYYRYGILFNHASLVDNGKAYSRGIDFTLRKKLSGKVYALVGGSLFTSRYRDANGTWRDRVFDNRALVTLEGGYKPNRRWEFSARWVYSGGQPYTPFDSEASTAINRGIFDAARINGDRLPANPSLNVRLDRRFIFKHSNLVTFASIWNAYNRKNVSLYYWNENREDEFNGWTLIPVLGMEYEF